MKRFYLSTVTLLFLLSIGNSQEVDYRIFQSPVKNQINRGTCTAFAIAAALETFPGFPNDLSEQYLYYLAKSANYDKIDDYDQGGALGFYIKALEQSGTLREDQAPYNPNAPIWNKKDSNFEKFKKDIQGSLFEYLQLNAFAYKLSPSMYQHLLGDQAKDIEFIKSQLDGGARAIPVGYGLNPDFWSNHPASKNNKIDPASFVQLSEGGQPIGFMNVRLIHGMDWYKKISNGTLQADYTDMRFKCDKGHAVAIVGYDSNGFLVKNSWGTENWGNKGYGWISFDYHRLFATEALILFTGKVVVYDEVIKDTEAWQSKDFYLKTLPAESTNIFTKEKKKGLSLSIIYHGKSQMPDFSEITYKAYNKDNQLLEKASCMVELLDFRSNGYEKIILKTDKDFYPNCHKVSVHFKTKRGKTFTNTYYSISARNEAHKPF